MKSVFSNNLRGCRPQCAIMGLLGCCSILLLGPGTAYSKMQQLSSDDSADPFAQSSSTFEEDTFNSNESVPMSSAVPLPQQNTVREKLLNSIRKESLSRPVWPERTVPGGLVSSSCVDPLMTGTQEAILMEQLQAIDDPSSIDVLSRWIDHLSQSLPIQLSLKDLEDEGIDPDCRISVIAQPAPLATKLEMTLRPLGLTYVCKAGFVMITTEASVDNSDGIVRVYDVSPLVDGIRNGMGQLTHNIMTAIEPDSWMENGGSSTLSPHIVVDGSTAVSTLIISAPTITHRRIQTLLDRLNELSGNSRRSSEPASSLPSVLNLNSVQSTKPLRFDDRVMSRGGF